MSLPRKDVRAKLDENIHAAMSAICEQAGIEHGEFIEALVIREVSKRFHDAIQLARAAERLGIAGNLGERSK
jgi:hypothetical protein